ncbi:integral membrane protein [Phyllosticta citricarpa]
MWSNIAAVALAGLASTAYAQVSNNCAGDTCFGLNIPEATVNSGNGDIFLSISGPVTYSWIGLGQGSSMTGARIFIIYTSADGRNVTVSPRLASGHSEPRYDSSTQVTILEGTGVADGTMTAYFKVANAGTWNGGSMDFKSSSAQWIHAALAGSQLNTDDLSADISKHGNNYGSFTWDFSQAKGGSSANPFTAAGATTSNSCPTNSGSGSGSGSSNSGSGSGSGGPGSGNGSPAGFPSSFPSGSPFSGGGFGGFGGFNRAEDNCATSANQLGQGFQAEIRRMRRIQTAHGVVAALAWAVFFPAGAISIRVFSFPGLVWFHAAWQIFSYGLYIAGFGLGVYLATQDNYMKEYHPIIGVVLFVLLFFQPIFGWLHHVLFKKYGGRTFWSHLHLWLGRILITLGVINGGLGLKLAGNTQKKYTVTYGVIAGIIWVVYMIAAVYGEVKRMKKPTRGLPPNYAEEDPHHKENGNGHRNGNGDYYGAYNPKPSG